MKKFRVTRLSLTLLLFLALGLATSVAVAWGATFLLFSQPHRSSQSAWLTTVHELRTISVIPAYVVQDSEDEAKLKWKWYPSGPLPGWSRFNTEPTESSDFVLEVAAGWPLHCLKFESISKNTFYDSFWNRREGALYGNLDLQIANRDLGLVTMLPLNPLMLNLFLNSIFWGAIAWVLVNFRSLIRSNRWLRRKPMKKCVTCGYDLRHAPEKRCPECGALPAARFSIVSPHAAPIAMFLLVVLTSMEIGGAFWFVSHRVSEPIHVAARQGDVEKVREELAKGVSVDQQILRHSYVGSTPLSLATSQGHVELVKMLLEEGADYDLADVTNYTPLYKAVATRQNELVRLLLDAGADPNIQGDLWGPLELASRRNVFNRQVISMLLKAGAVPNPVRSQYQSIPLANAISLDEKDIVLEMVHARGKLSSMAICYLYHQEGTGFLDAMLKQGFKLGHEKAYGPTIWFCYCIGEQDREFWEWLLTLSPDVTVIDQIGDPTIFDDSGHTALSKAVERKSQDLVRFLIEHGADPTHAKESGVTVLDLAVDPEMQQLIQDAIKKWNDEHDTADEEQSP